VVASRINIKARLLEVTYNLKIILYWTPCNKFIYNVHDALSGNTVVILGLSVPTGAVLLQYSVLWMLRISSCRKLTRRKKWKNLGSGPKS